ATVQCCPSGTSSASPARAPVRRTRRAPPDSNSACSRPVSRRSGPVTTTEATLDALLHENRRFEPPEDLAREANAKPGLYDEAARDRIGFWEKQAEWLTWT